MCELYHYRIRSADFTKRNQTCESNYYCNRTAHFPRKIICVSCIIILNGMSNLLEVRFI